MFYIVIYITNDMETHQLILLLKYHEAVGLDWTSALVRERFYWSTMNHDVTKYVTNCHQDHVTKGHYTDSHIQQGLLVANNPWTCCVLIF